MDSKTIIIYVLFYVQTVLSKNDYYRAAVVDYKTKIDKAKTPMQNLLSNVEEYNQITTDAKNDGIEIIVFPEYGLTGTKIKQTKNDYLPYTSVIPDSDETYCDENEKISIVLKKLSCIAKHNQIYVVVNLPERVDNDNENKTQDYFFYNTDIIFDKNGKIIAKYRKVNLYGEPAFDPNLDENNLVTFETDFGVTFGVFTCFDILFYDPALRLIKNNITNFIFPTAWMSELPFLTALQVQSGWTRSNRVNLLASNLQDPENLFAGSGIYSATKGNLNYTIPAIGDETKVLTANVPIINRNDKFSFDQKEIIPIKKSDVPKYIPKVADMKNYTLEEITTSEYNKYLIKHQTVSCKFDIKMDNYDSDYYYRMVAYDGPIYLGESLNYIKTCGIITCMNSSKASCGFISMNKQKLHQFKEIKIESNINNNEKMLTFPSVIGYDLNPIPFNNYDFNYNRIKLKQPIKNLITFGIYQIYKSNGVIFLSNGIIFLSIIILNQILFD